MTSTVSEESLVRDTHTHSHRHRHRQTHTHRHRHRHRHTHTNSQSSIVNFSKSLRTLKTKTVQLLTQFLVHCLHLLPPLVHSRLGGCWWLQFTAQHSTDGQCYNIPQRGSATCHTGAMQQNATQEQCYNIPQRGNATTLQRGNATKFHRAAMLQHSTQG